MTFEEWLNRPVSKAQVYTASICKALLDLPAGDLATRGDHPIMLLRLVPKYRTHASLALRKQIADIVRQQRAAGTYNLKKVTP